MEHVQLNKLKLSNKLSVSVILVFCELEPSKENGRELTHLMKDYGEDIKSRSATNNVQPHIITTKIHNNSLASSDSERV